MSELFIHNLSGHRKGLEWKITDGTRRYNFTTNWINEFPYIIDDYNINNAGAWALHLQALLDEQGAPHELNLGTIKSRGGKGSITVEMERADFEKIRATLKETKIFPEDENSTSEFEQFQHNFSAQARWSIPRYQKIHLSNELEELLLEQVSLNKSLQEVQEYLQGHNTLVQDVKEHVEKLYDTQGPHAVMNFFVQQFDPKGRKPLPKFYREHSKKRLEELVNATPQDTYFENYEHRNDIIGIMAKTAVWTVEHQAFLQAKKALRDPSTLEDELVREQVTDILAQKKYLEQRLRTQGHSLHLRTNSLEYLTHFNIMHRDMGVVRLRDIELLKNETGGLALMSAEEFLTLPKAFYDIEKPQFDTWMEVISWCATLIEYDGKTQRILDTDKNIPEEVIEGYKVRRHSYEHELNKAIGKLVEHSYLHFIYNITYEASQMREEGSFEVEGTTPRKKATVDTDVPAKRDFMARWEMNKYGMGIDWMRFSRIAKPHRPTHRLESYMNHQRERAGKDKAFLKIVDYVQMRVADQWARYIDHDKLTPSQAQKAESLGNLLARYTVSDVEIMYQNTHLLPTREDFEDAIDVAHTFGLDVSQVFNNANTVREKIDQRFFELHGYFNDEGFFRELHRAEIQSFKSNYTRIKKKTFSESGLDVEFTPGLHHGIDQYYFSPELTIARLLENNFPEVREFAERTLEISDPERQVGRFQYLRAFAIPALSDHNHLRKRRKRLGDIVKELEDKAHKTREIQEALDKGFWTDEIQEDSELLGILQPLKTHLSQEQGVKTPFKELHYLISRFLNDYEKINQEHTKGIKGRLQTLRSWRNRVSFFQEIYGTDLETLEQGIFDAFENASTIVQEQGAQVRHLEGKFLYVSGEIDQEMAVQAGLIKIQENLTVLASGNENLTYNNDGFYKGKRNSRPIATHTRSRLIQQTEYGILDRLFEQDFKGALEVLAEGAYKTLHLSASDRDELLTHTRSRGVYKGWVAGEEKPVEFTELEKKNFNPDLGRYIEEYMDTFFGEGKRNVKKSSQYAQLIDAVIPLDGRGKFMGFGIETLDTSELYLGLLSGESAYGREEIIAEMVKDYRLR